MKTPIQHSHQLDGSPVRNLIIATSQEIPSVIRTRSWLRRAGDAIARLTSAAFVLACASHFSNAQTFQVSDVSAPGANPSFATGVNATGQVSGYSTIGANGAQAGRFTLGAGAVGLGSFGGADSRALGINDAGNVTGYSTDSAGLAHGFVFSTAGGLTDLGGNGSGGSIFPQHINAGGQVAGFSSLAGSEQAFRFTPPGFVVNLATIPNATAPATISAYGVNDGGRVVGVGTSANDFNRAFRTDSNGANVTDLGTLGGDESFAYAINNAGQVAGTSSSVSIDTHAFIFADVTGMTDLGTLGGYVSTAYALNNPGTVVGTAQNAAGDMRAFAWTPTGGMRDLNDFIPVNSGWVLTEARGINDTGMIVGNGLLNGQPRAYSLTPNTGQDTAAPVAIAKANDITVLSSFGGFITVTFWDDVKVSNATIGATSLRVTGPNGYSQLATFYSKTPTTDAMKVVANFYAAAPGLPGSLWNGAANGAYSIVVEPNVVSDVAGNFMPGGVVGTFTVATELKPVVSIAPPNAGITMAQPTVFTLTALSSFPYAATDVFTFTVDWKNDGTDVQTITGTTGTTLTHTYTSTGVFGIKVNATDVHGVSSGDVIYQAYVSNPPYPQASVTAPVLTGSRRLAVGLNQTGTILCLGGLPLKSGKDIVNTLTPGATLFTDAQRLSLPTIGLGAGIDSLNRVIVFGGIEPAASLPKTTGYIYTTGGGPGAGIPGKNIAVHDFAFTSDNLHRVYSIGGAKGAGLTGATAEVERYDAATNTWTVLASLPSPRISATASYDAHGHILVFGGTDAAGAQTLSTFSYDIAKNTWTQLGNVPLATGAGRVAQLGADNLVYLVGGAGTVQTSMYDSAADAWFSGPALSIARSTPAVTLGDDGFIYVMGGDNPAQGNNGLATTEKFNTSATIAPQIVSYIYFYGTTLHVGTPFSYKAIALGNPRPTFSLTTAPSGMTIDPITGIIAWTPVTANIGNNIVTVRATSSAGFGEQTFTIPVTPVPIIGDITLPTAPASISLVHRSATTVTLTWPAGSDDVGVVSYNIYGLIRRSGRSGGSRITLIKSGITGRSYIASSGASAYYVAAVDAAGNVSPLSPGVSAGVLTLPVIGLTTAAPASVIVGNSYQVSLTAAGTPMPTFTTISGPAGMTLSRTNGPIAGNDYAVVQWEPTSAQLGVNTFTVFATNPNTTGGSATFTVNVLPNGYDIVKPTPVAQMTVSNLTADHATLTWTAAGDNIGVTNYHVVATHFGAPGEVNQVITADIPGTELTTLLTGLTPAAGYTVSITPSDAAGNVGPSTSIFFGTPSGTVTPPSAVHTFAISDVSAPGGNPNFATGVNASGQVSGYATLGANGAQAWRFTSGAGTAILPSFGGVDARALGINDAGKVTGYSTDGAGLAHGFIYSTTAGLTDIGGNGTSASIFAQHINASGQVAGFSSSAGLDQAFRFSPPATMQNLPPIPTAPAPAGITAYGMNDAGRVVGTGSSSSGFNRALSTDASGAIVTELGTLGGDESYAYAINNAGQIVGTSASLSIDTHAFLFTDGAGMTDLGTLGGYVSSAFALDSAGNVVGAAQDGTGAMRAFVWSATLGMRDLNEYVPVNSGWVLTEARGINDAGVIVGSGTFNGQVRAFLLTPKSGADIAPPVAVAKAANITNISAGAQIFPVTFWDDVSVLNASVAQGALRVTGPNGYNQIATFYNKAAVADAIKVVANFYVTSADANALWTGATNGSYTISIEPNVVRDTAGNYMPGGVIGTFIVTTETKPLAYLAPTASPVTMGVPTTYTIGAQSSYPSAATDVFTFVIDWKNDGANLQTVTGVSGTTVTHTFSSTGTFNTRLTATDTHGVSTGDLFFPVGVVNPGNPQTWSAAPQLSNGRGLAAGVNSSGTLLAIGGTPTNGPRAPVDALAPGAAQFAQAAQLPTAPIGIGAGIDSLNRVIIFGGIDPGAASPKATAFAYTTTGGAGAAIGVKTFAVHDFAFATDNLRRIYSIGGATRADASAGIASVERYDAATNSWTTLAPLPEARIGATATYDSHGHVIVIGGIEPVSGLAMATVFSYDIATNTWAQLSNVPNGATTGRVAATGADGLVYLIGGLNSAAVLVFDSVADSWYSAPSLSTPRNAPAVALGDDSFLYVMGGDYPAASNNALDTVEKIDTGSTIAPQIISFEPSAASVQLASTFSYKVIALGNPRPVLSLAAAPAGMTLDAVTGLITWTPAENQTGTTTVTVRATSSAGIGEQTFAIAVTPIPTDTIKPTAPASIALTARSATTVTLTWPAGSDNVGIVSYNVYGLFRRFGRGGGSFISLLKSGITGRSYIASGANLAYYVAAVDAAGNISLLSPPVAGGVLTLPVITRTNFNESTTVIVGNSLLLSLTASANPGPPTFSAFTGPAGLTVARTAGPNPLLDYAVVQWQPTAADVGVNTFTVSATNPNTTGGSATFTVTVLPNGTDTVKPTPVAQITASNVSFDHCTLTWTPAGDNIGVTNYHIVATHFGLPGVPNHIVTLDIAGTELTTPLTGLLPAAIYNVSITPSDAANNVGPTTSSLVFTTLTQPFVNFRTLPGVANGTLSLDWQNAGPGWNFTVEYTDSLATPNWQPVVPASQWPSAITHFVTTPDPLVRSRFFRVKASATGL